MYTYTRARVYVYMYMHAPRLGWGLAAWYKGTVLARNCNILGTVPRALRRPRGGCCFL